MKNLNKKIDLYCWACDFSPDKGEGILARHYILNLSKILKKNIFIKTPNSSYYIKNGFLKNLKINNKKKSKLNFNFFENYFYPMVGILYLWINYLNKRGVCYLNFLPLWNIFLYIFLPPKTHLGPITGFIFKKKITNFNFFLRKYLNNLLFKLNLKILFYRQNKVYFSTDLLKDFITKENKKKIFFNYLINLIEIKNISKKKNIDLLIYNRNYSVKNNSLRNKLLTTLSKINLKIYAIGDYLPINNIKNLGFVTRKECYSLLNRTKFIINSGENPYNIFTIDAFNNHANIIYENILSKKIKFFNKNKLFFLCFTQPNKIIKFFNKKNHNTISLSLLTNNYYSIKNKNVNYFNSVKIYYTII